MGKITDLPFNKTDEMNDLWTIFTKCPIEKGHIDVYHDFCRARERAAENIKTESKSLGDDGMGM